HVYSAARIRPASPMARRLSASPASSRSAAINSSISTGRRFVTPLDRERDSTASLVTAARRGNGGADHTVLDVLDRIAPGFISFTGTELLQHEKNVEEVQRHQAPTRGVHDPAECRGPRAINDSDTCQQRCDVRQESRENINVLHGVKATIRICELDDHAEKCR